MWLCIGTTLSTINATKEEKSSMYLCVDQGSASETKIRTLIWFPIIVPSMIDRIQVRTSAGLLYSFHIIVLSYSSGFSVTILAICGLALQCINIKLWPMTVRKIPDDLGKLSESIYAYSSQTLACFFVMSQA